MSYISSNVCPLILKTIYQQIQTRMYSKKYLCCLYYNTTQCNNKRKLPQYLKWTYHFFFSILFSTSDSISFWTGVMCKLEVLLQIKKNSKPNSYQQVQTSNNNLIHREKKKLQILELDSSERRVSCLSITSTQIIVALLSTTNNTGKL